MLTQDRLKTLLHYSPETGDWTWLVNRQGRGAKIGSRPNSRNRGYFRIKVDGQSYLAHRLAWFYMTGEWPVAEVDHEDRNRGNNRWSNLRLATRSQNAANCGAHTDSLSGVKGVTCDKRRKSNPFRAIIGVNGSYIHLGCFPTIEDASAAYAAAATQYFGEFGVAA